MNAKNLIAAVAVNLNNGEKMNAKNLIAAVAVFAAASSAFAQQHTYPNVDYGDFKSTNIRAEVIAQLEQARASGTYVVGGQEYVDPAANFVSTKTRAQVLAELKRAQQDGPYVVGGQESVDPVTSRTAAAGAKPDSTAHQVKAANGVTSNQGTARFPN